MDHTEFFPDVRHVFFLNKKRMPTYLQSAHDEMLFTLPAFPNVVSQQELTGNSDSGWSMISVQAPLRDLILSVLIKKFASVFGF